MNQLRAGLANSLEESQYSAICRRILAAKQREAEVSQRWLQGIRLCRETFTDTEPDTRPPGASSDGFT